MYKKLESIEKKIGGVKEELMAIGEMRPGSLTYQYQRPKEKKGGFYQISYTYRMKSKTEYVKAEFVQDLKGQIATFKRFKKTYATVGRSGYPTLKDKNHACKGRQNQATLMIKNSVLSRKQ